MAREASPYQVKLKDVRLSFAKLFTPEASIEGGQKKYGAAFLMDPETKSGQANIALIEEAIEKLKKDTWKSKAGTIRIKEDRICFGAGEEKGVNSEGDVYDGYMDMMVVDAKNAKRPTVIGKDREPILEEDDIIFSGCYVNAIIRFYAVTDAKKGGNGIFASLEGVQYKRKGEAFGAAPLDPDEFDDESDEDDDDDESPI